MNRSRRLPTSLGLVAACIAVSVLTGCGPPKLWSEANWNEPVRNSPQAIASQVVEFNLEKLGSAGKQELKLTLPDGTRLVARRYAVEATSENRYVWTGSVVDDPGGVVTLAVNEGVLVGNIVTGQGRMFSIRHLAGNIALIEELDPSKFATEEGSGQPDAAVRPGRPPDISIDGVAPPVSIQPQPATGIVEAIGNQPLAQETAFIDVTVLYTQGAIDAENGEGAVVARIDLAVSQVNRSFKDSGIDAQLRLQDAQKTDYVDKGDVLLDWNSLSNNAQIGQFARFATGRQTRNADIVVLLTKDAAPGESCGQAAQMHAVAADMCSSAYAVVPINCATTQYSFAHELGHLMGADHNKEAQVSGPPFAYSRGYIAESRKWRTIMSYPSTTCPSATCMRILRWSSHDRPYPDPNQPGLGDAQPEATGSDSADNAKALGLTVKTVAGFSDACAPT